MIIIRISGGLGNQLFQYSFGRFLSLNLNTSLKFDDQTNYKYGNFTKRCIGLEHFNLKLDFATREDIRRYKYVGNEFFVRIERKVIQKFPHFSKSYFVQNFHNHKNLIGEYRNNCYYDGYWQSEKYFKSIESVIRKDLNFKIKLSNLNSIFLDDIYSKNSISLHVRRGDYLSVKAHKRLFSECSIDYYNKAIESFSSKFRNPVFFVFSDDISWAKENFKGIQFRFIDSNPDSPELDMFLMSQCKNNIIANSSFSWWAAWLNSNPDKLVIAPKNWYVGLLNEETHDLVPETWLRI